MVDGHLEQDGVVRVSDVLASFYVANRAGKQVWDGQLIVQPQAPIKEERYVLVLDDGRRGEIQVDSVSHAHGQPAAIVHFVGAGPLAKPE